MKKLLALGALLIPIVGWADCDQPNTPYCSLQPSHVVAAVIDTSIVEAIYPSISKRIGEWGIVFLRVLITTQGDVGEIEILTSSGYPRLDQSAVEAIKKWKFTPTMKDGKAINEWYVQPYSFRLSTERKTLRSSPCLNDYINQGIYNPVDAGWKKMFLNEETYVGNISKSDINKSWSEILKLDGKGKTINRQMFELIKNNVEIKSGVLGSLSSYRIFDCTNNEMHILQESLYSCQWGTGDMLPIKDGIQLEKWMPVPTSSKDAELLEYVCSKG